MHPHFPYFFSINRQILGKNKFTLEYFSLKKHTLFFHQLNLKINWPLLPQRIPWVLDILLKISCVLISTKCTSKSSFYSCSPSYSMYSLIQLTLSTISPFHQWASQTTVLLAKLKLQSHNLTTQWILAILYHVYQLLLN